MKWFNHNKGYGFIKPTDGSEDIFVHVSELRLSTIKVLKEKQKIEYIVGRNKGKKSATSIKLL